MGWISRYRRRKLLLRWLKESDARFDALAREYDQLNALSKLLGRAVAVDTMPPAYAQLHLQNKKVDAEYLPIEDELERLDASSLSLWLTNTLVDASVLVAVIVIAPVRNTWRRVRKLRSGGRSRSKKPARPGNDESLRLSCQGCGFSNIRITSFLFFLGFVCDGNLLWLRQRSERYGNLQDAVFEVGADLITIGTFR